MAREDEISPSTLHSKYKNLPKDVPVDHESLLLDLLSLLSSLGNVGETSPNRDDDIGTNHGYDIISWMNDGLNRCLKSNINGEYQVKGWDEDLVREWSSALDYTSDLIQHIPPLEVHLLASQSIFFAEGPTTSYRILCILLCTHSLRQCPVLQKRRWKRWQSIVCETLRLFQDSLPLLHEGDGNAIHDRVAATLFSQHVVPSCLCVVDQLPIENSYHVAIFSALVGTSSTILERKIVEHQKIMSKIGSKISTDSLVSDFDGILEEMSTTIESLRSRFDRFGVFSETSLWISPILPHFERDSNRNEDVEFLMHRDKLSWWSHQKDAREERFARMDTSINGTGLALLATKAFQGRPLVYHPIYLWKVWFPHVVLMFKMSVDCPSLLEESSSALLESLVSLVPKRSLQTKDTSHGDEDASIGIFHFLSERLMTRVPVNANGKEDNSLDTDLAFKIRSQRTVALTKALLSRFRAYSQVQIVRKVLNECATPGLKARFLDLLRPLIPISDYETEAELWDLLVSIIENHLFKHHCDFTKPTPVITNIDSLIDQDVEVSIGAITMIQIWSMVDGKAFPLSFEATKKKLEGFYSALQKLLDTWSEEASSAPKFHFRLFLLDSSISNALRSLEGKNA